MTDRHDLRVELRRFYETEAAQESREPPSGRRVAACSDFVEVLQADAGRAATCVLDLGAGPGSDAAAFTSAGLRHVGVDLAVANASLAARRGHVVVPASLFALPFRAGSFDAMWSMSTLMHVPEDEVPLAFGEIRRVCRRGSIVGIGQWGGSLGEIVSDVTVANDNRRLFSLRSAERNRSLLDAFGVVGRFEVWDTGPANWEYHFAVLRLP